MNMTLRDDFPALAREIDGDRICYLDNAATTLKPRPVIDAITGFYESNGANIHRGKHRLSEEASDAYEASRGTIADYVESAANEVVLLRNTTEALNLVAQGLELAADATVVGCLDAHHSQMLPWRRAGRLKLTRVDAQGRVDRDHFRTLLRDRPAVVALTHCSNVTGVVHPVAEMIAEVREACDATIVVDAAQSLPHERLSLRELGADFLAFSMHKMLGPTGVGCLVGRADRLAGLRPLNLGGGMVDWVDLDSWVERRIPYRFEAGTPAIESVIGSAAAIRYLESLDEDRRRAHEHELSAALVRGVRAVPQLRLFGPDEGTDRVGLVTVRLPSEVSAGEIARVLSDSYGYMVRSGHMCAQPLVTHLAGGETLRVSTYLYNEVAEIEGFFGALSELVSWLGVDPAHGAPVR